MWIEWLIYDASFKVSWGYTRLIRPENANWSNIFFFKFGHVFWATICEILIHQIFHIVWKIIKILMDFLSVGAWFYNSHWKQLLK